MNEGGACVLRVLCCTAGSGTCPARRRRRGACPCWDGSVHASVYIRRHQKKQAVKTQSSNVITQAEDQYCGLCMLPAWFPGPAPPTR